MPRWRIRGPEALPAILRWFYRSAETQQRLSWAILVDESKGRYKPLVEGILASPDRLRITPEAMEQFALLANEWKTNFDDAFVDWVFAQPPDPNPYGMAPPRGIVLSTSGVARKLIADPRFLKADSQLLYQCRLPYSNLTRPQARRLYELISGIDPQNPQNTAEATLQEIRNLLRQGTDVTPRPPARNTPARSVPRG